MPRSKEIKLDRLLDSVFSGAEAPTNLQHGDEAFLREDYAAAAAAYGELEGQTEETRAKRGFSIAMFGDFADAEALLTPDNVGKHPVARALLAWVLAGRYGSHLSLFGSKESAERRKWREAHVNFLLGSVLSESKPPYMAFVAAFELTHRTKLDALALAERACELYPAWELPHDIRASRRRVAGRIDHSELDALLQFVPTSNRADLLQEAYTYAVMLSRYDEAESVVQAIEELILKDEQHGDRNRASLDEMRAMVDLRRAREGDLTCYDRVKRRMESWAGGVLPTGRDSREPGAAPAFLLQVALETDSPEGISANALRLIDAYWSPRGTAGNGLDGWDPVVSSPSLDGTLRFGHFGFEFRARWRQIAQHLDGAAAQRWRLLVAGDEIDCGEPDDEQLQLIRSADLEAAPWWFLQKAYSAYVDFEPFDYAGAGALLALTSERVAAAQLEEARGLEVELDFLAVDSQGSGPVVEMFEGAFAWLAERPRTTGQVLLKVWGQIIADNGGHDVLARIASLSLEREVSEVAQDCLDQANELADNDPASALRRALVKFPDPDQTCVQPESLSLLEAAALVALLRASPIDHIRWTLAPIEASGRAFDPTRLFLKVLFQLMHKGVIAADLSTPAGALEVKDGQIWATLDRVVWRISAHTLDLHRSIRDMPHTMWPSQWRSHAPTLARDLGVEEMVAYIEYLLEDRGLPVPEYDELRTVFRGLLEKLSIAQCYYLAHKTMLSALDYKTKYRPGIKQIESRTINVLRDNGDRAIAAGWDTRYRRIKEMPASLLFEALHDVLTGWGERAFNEPVMSLSLEGSDSATRH